jgi:hypothetical protein
MPFGTYPNQFVFGVLSHYVSVGVEELETRWLISMKTSARLSPDCGSISTGRWRKQRLVPPTTKSKQKIWGLFVDGGISVWG